MAPSGSKSKAYSNPISTQADDAKYRTKYKELKAKLSDIEEDNTKLSVKILKSKKAIQRLRIERAILYDRLTSTTSPSNPYSLSSSLHLSNLASTSSLEPLSILSHPSYPLSDPSAPSLYLKQLDKQKLAALQRGEAGFGERVKEGVEGEGKRESEEKELMSVGGERGGLKGQVSGRVGEKEIGSQIGGTENGLANIQPQPQTQIQAIPGASTTTTTSEQQGMMQVDQS